MDTQSKPSRLNELTYVNVLFTLFVIMIHILGEPFSALDRASFQFFIIFTPWKLFQFVTQGFVFLSGIKLFLKPREHFDLGRFYLGRAKRVLLPYIIWVIVYYLYFIRIGYFAFDLGELLHYIAFGDISAQFYFVIAICQFYLLTPLINRVLHKCDGIFAVIYSLMITLLLGQFLPQIVALFKPEYWFAYNDRIFTTYLFYFVAGAVIGKNYAAFKEKLKRSIISVCIMFVFFTIANLTLSYLHAVGKIYISWLEPLHLAYCISAILFVLALAVKLSDRTKAVNGVIKALDSSSYMLYLSHILVLHIFRDKLSALGVTDAALRLMLVILLMTAYTALSVFVWEYLKKHFAKFAK